MSSKAAAEIVVVGSCMMDLVFYVERMPAVGETMHCESFATGFGGKGANQAVQAARAYDGGRGKVAMVAAVGSDGAGASTVANFEDAGVDTACVTAVDGASTGMAQINVDAAGSNAIVIAANANSELGPEHVAAAAELIQGAKVLVTQLEVPLETTLAALRVGAACPGTTTVFNPAPAVAQLPDELYGLVDYITPNETETAILTGLPVNTMDELAAAAAVLIARGAKNVILTLGERGALWLTNEPGAEPVVIPVPAPVDPSLVVDTTGAGDSFMGAFAYYIAQGLGPADAIKHAHAFSAASVQAKGTQTSYKTRADIEANAE